MATVATDLIARNQKKQAPYPSYSPDLPRSNFFLFGQVKIMPMRYHTDSLSEVIVRIRVILPQIPPETLYAAFLNCVE
jgi:hypothetical protein